MKSTPSSPLLIPNVHYRVRKRTPLYFIRSQFNPIHILILYLRSISILPSRLLLGLVNSCLRLNSKQGMWINSGSKHFIVSMIALRPFLQLRTWVLHARHIAIIWQFFHKQIVSRTKPNGQFQMECKYSSTTKRFQWYITLLLLLFLSVFSWWG